MVYSTLPPMIKKSTWGNCGFTRTNVVELAALTAADQAPVSYDKNNAAQLPAVLQPVDGNPLPYTIFSIVIDGVHEFLIDRAPDGRIALVQGYSGAYDAIWWCDGVKGQPCPDMDAIRAKWGRGQNIADFYNDLITKLRDLLLCESWTDLALTTWKDLPFFPGDRMLTTFKNTSKTIQISVQRFIAGINTPALNAGHFTSVDTVVNQSCALYGAL